MEVKGKLIKKLEVQSGISKAGKDWKKQTVVIDTGEDFNNIIAISAFGDKLEQLEDLEENMNVAISCNVYSREYNGRYYHNIDGYWFTSQDNKESKKEFITSDDMPF